MAQSNLVSLGARIPVDLKKNIDDYCDHHGVKMRFFVIQALKEKLLEIKQMANENAIVDERLKTAEFTSKEALVKYMALRKKRG